MWKEVKTISVHRQSVWYVFTVLVCLFFCPHPYFNWNYHTVFPLDYGSVIRGIFL